MPLNWDQINASVGIGGAPGSKPVQPVSKINYAKINSALGATLSNEDYAKIKAENDAKAKIQAEADAKKEQLNKQATKLTLAQKTGNFGLDLFTKAIPQAVKVLGTITNPSNSPFIAPAELAVKAIIKNASQSPKQDVQKFNSYNEPKLNTDVSKIPTNKQLLDIGIGPVNYNNLTDESKKQIWEGIYNNNLSLYKNPKEGKLTKPEQQKPWYLYNAFDLVNTVKNKTKELLVNDNPDKASTIYNISKEYNIPEIEVSRNYDAYIKDLGLQNNPTAKQVTLAMITAPIGVELSLVGLGKLALGAASFTAAKEALNYSFSKFKGEQYKYGEALSAKLPDYSSDFAKNSVDLIETLGIALATSYAFKKAPGIATRLTKNITTKYNVPSDYFIEPAKVKDIFQTGKLISKEEMQLISDLGLDATGYKNAISNGVSIRIPAEKIVTIVDKPYWAKIKSLVGVKPFSESTSTLNNKVTQGVRGYLESSEHLSSSDQKLINQSIEQVKTDLSKQSQIINESIGIVRGNSNLVKPQDVKIDNIPNVEVKKFEVLQPGGARVEVKGQEITLHPSIKTFIFKQPDGSFSINESITGANLANAPTIEEAKQTALERITENHDKIGDTINQFLIDRTDGEKYLKESGSSYSLLFKQAQDSGDMFSLPEDNKITVYHAAKDPNKTAITYGDFVTTDKNLAYSLSNNVIEKDIPASQLFTNDYLYNLPQPEFVYQGGERAIKTEIAKPIKLVEIPKNEFEIKLANAQSRVLEELENAEAGKRFAVPQNKSNDMTTVVQNSSFPQWISESLRSSKLITEVLQAIEAGRVPTSGKAIELFKEVSERIKLYQSANQSDYEAFGLNRKMRKPKEILNKNNDNTEIQEDKGKSLEEFIASKTDPLFEFKTLKTMEDPYIARGTVKEAIRDIGGLRNVMRGEIDINKLEPTEAVSINSQRFKDVKAEIQRGIVTPIIVDENLQVMDGNHRLKAFKELGMEKVPVVAPKETNGIEVKTKAELTDIWNQANQTKPMTEDSLIEEAKKYKSAEEFVKGRKIVYHGTDSFAADAIQAKGFSRDKQIGLSFTTDKDVAQEFAEARARQRGTKPVVMEVDITDVKNPNYNKFVEGKESEIFVNVDDIINLKTKSQLEDIWNKANNEIYKSPSSNLPETKTEGISRGAGAIDEFEQINQPIEPSERFKLYDKTLDLIKKYAKTIGENYLPKQAAGVFYTASKNIRAKSLNDVAVVAHELTHFLDDANLIIPEVMIVTGETVNGNPMYDKQTKPIRQQLTQIYVEAYHGAKATDPLRLRMVEGLAVLLQKYIEQPTVVSNKYPELVNQFLMKGGQFYKPVIGEMIADVRKIVAEYQSLDPLSKIKSRQYNDSIDLAKDELLTKPEKIRYQMVDDLLPFDVIADKVGVKNTVDNPRYFGQTYRAKNRIIANNVTPKKGYMVIGPNGNVITPLKHNFGDIIAELGNGKKWEDFNAWLTARRKYFDFQIEDKLKGRYIIKANEIADNIINAASYIEEINPDFKYSEQRMMQIVDIIKSLGKELPADPKKAYTQLSKNLAEVEAVLNLARTFVAEDMKINGKEGDSPAKSFLRSVIEVKRSAKMAMEQIKLNINDAYDKDIATDAYLEHKGNYVELEKMYDSLVLQDLKTLHRAGLLTDSQFKDFISNPGYSPMKRKIFDQLIGEPDMPNVITSGKTKVSSLIRRKGSSKAVIAPVAASVANHVEVTKKALLQYTYNKIVTLALQHPQELGSIMQKQELKKFADKNGVVIYPQEKDPNIIMGRFGGKRIPVLVDKYVKQAMEDLITVKNFTIFEKILFTATRAFTAGTTGIYLPFTITNKTVDMISAVAQTKTSYKPIYDEIRVFGRAIVKSGRQDLNDAFVRYIALGGDLQTYYGMQQMNPQEMATAIINEKKGIRKVVDLVEKGIDIVGLPGKYSEISTRFIEFYNALKAGDSDIVAMEKAGQVTAPFHHVGHFGGSMALKTYVKTLPFFNAAMQVLAKSAETAGDKSSRGRFLTVWAAVIAASVGAAAYIAKNGSDQQKRELEGLSPQQLAMYIYMPKPDGKNLYKIRIPDQFGAIAAVINLSMLEATIDAKYSKSEYFDAATAWIPAQFNVVRPANMILSLLPQILRPALEVVMGQKTYPKVRPLESQTMKALPPGERSYEYTTPGAKMLGQMFNVSPIIMDHLVKGYLGRAVGYLTLDKNAYNLGSAVTQEEYFSASRQVENYYTLTEKYNQLKKSATLDPAKYTNEQKTIILKMQVINDNFSLYMKSYKKHQDSDPEKAENIIPKVINLIDKANEYDKRYNEINN